MRILLDDIARTLGASSVTLPASQEALTWSAFATRSDGPQNQRLSQLPQNPVRDSLPIELQKLSIEEPSHQRLAEARGRKDVSGSAYRSLQGLVPQSTAVQRQIA
jgi:hypothetical protein